MTLPERAMAWARARSSSGPRDDGSMNRISRAIAAGLPRLTMSRNLACSALGQGQGMLSSTKESSSMVTMTTGVRGARGPRSVNCALTALSSL